jgi:hypothetical protein
MITAGNSTFKISFIVLRSRGLSSTIIICLVISWKSLPPDLFITVWFSLA